MRIIKKIQSVTFLLSIFFAIVIPSFALAQDCTNIIDFNCDDTGSSTTIDVCADGTDPYEDDNSGSWKSKIETASQGATTVSGVEYYISVLNSYRYEFGHSWGMCTDGSEPYQEPSTNIEDTGLWKLLLTIINILTGGIAITAVGGVIYASILYSSAGGSSDNIKKAKAMFMNIIIGVIAYALMYAFLNYIIPGGIL